MIKTTAIVINYLLISAYPLFAQDSLSKKKSPFSFNTDLVTSYVWRGQEFSRTPNLQPYLTFKKGGFQFGSWGSGSISGDYKEVDLFASYTLSNFSITATDYYSFYGYPKENYFDYSKNTTIHLFEGSISFLGTKKFPLTILASAFIYGLDKDTKGNNYYSSYFEAGYSFSNINVIIGVTPKKGYYGSGMGVVNAGIKLNKEIKITNTYSIPASISLLCNPMSEKIFLVAGFTF